MAKFWTEILVPIAIAGAVAAQTVGVEVNRAARLHAWFPAAVRDTLVHLPDSQSVATDSLRSATDSLRSVPDSLRSAADSLAEEEDFDLFGAAEDTVPTVFARDTMKVPDSLRLTDPFL